MYVRVLSIFWTRGIIPGVANFKWISKFLADLRSPVADLEPSATQSPLFSIIFVNASHRSSASQRHHF